MTTTYYRLSCSDAEMILAGPSNVNLRQAVRTALAEFTDEELIEPHDDWFLAIVKRVCSQTGCEQLDSFADEYDVEDDYFVEATRRQEHREAQSVPLRSLARCAFLLSRLIDGRHDVIPNAEAAVEEALAILKREGATPEWAEDAADG